MKMVNFMDDSSQLNGRSLRIWYLTSLTIFVIIFCIISFIEIKQLWNYFDIKHQHDIILQYVNEQQVFIEKKKKLDIAKKSLSTKLHAINTINNLPTKILINIAQYIPNNCKLNNLKYKNNIITLKGNSRTTKDLTDFLDNLSQNHEFFNTRLTSFQQDSSGYIYEIKINRQI